MLIDAPISGRPAELLHGQVALFVGGAPDILAPLGPVLDALGHSVAVGPTGSAAAMKLGVNAVVFGLVAAVSECLALTTAAGVEPGLAYDVLRSSAVASTFIDLRRGFFVEDPPPPVQFSMKATQETLELIAQAASEAGVVLPQTATNLATTRAAVESGRAADDVTRLSHFLISSRSTPATEGSPT